MPSLRERLSAERINGRLGDRLLSFRSGDECPACGRRVRNDGHGVVLRGFVYHAECALYRRDTRTR